MKHTGERAIAGTTRGLVSLHDEVTWEARHLFIRQRLTSRITALDPPHFFADEMVKGAFHSFRHEHRFDVLFPTTTRVTDTFTFRSPLGPLGHLADALFVTRHMRSLLRNHQRNLKSGPRLRSLARIHTEFRPLTRALLRSASQLHTCKQTAIAPARPGHQRAHIAFTTRTATRRECRTFPRSRKSKNFPHRAHDPII
ncbi:MAG TPA: SRPBCC family protein [Phycisphaerales bacterium]|nr:SRPBCC family protein [Phycisphaerales bacterium]